MFVVQLLLLHQYLLVSVVVILVMDVLLQIVLVLVRNHFMLLKPPMVFGVMEI